MLTRRALNRASLARQMLLERVRLPVADAIERLVGLQAQTPHTAYVGLWTRLEGFRPDELSELLVRRAVVRLALMRSTIHMVTARDAWAIRPLVHPVLERQHKGQFARRLDGVDLDELIARGRAYVDAGPRTFRALGDHLLERWPDHDRLALEQTIRMAVPLIQVPPRGLWGRSGPIAHTSIEAWLGDPPEARPTLDWLVRRYLGAFGPASVMDAQAWCGLTKLGEVFERLRPELIAFRDEQGKELFDLPDAPRPHPDTPAPPRFLYDYENLLLSYADRSRAIPPGVVARVAPDTQELISTFLVDGSVAGTWKVRRDGDAAVLDVRSIDRLSSRDEAGLHAEAEGLVRFLASGAVVHDIRFGRLVERDGPAAAG